MPLGRTYELFSILKSGLPSKPRITLGIECVHGRGLSQRKSGEVHAKPGFPFGGECADGGCLLIGASR